MVKERRENSLQCRIPVGRTVSLAVACSISQHALAMAVDGGWRNTTDGVLKVFGGRGTGASLIKGEKSSRPIFHLAFYF